MNHVTCRAGHTQITRVLRHALHETTTGQPVSALCYVGDMCEDDPDELMQAARALGQPKVPTFMFQEGRNPSAILRWFWSFRDRAGGSEFCDPRGSRAPMRRGIAMC